MKSFNQFTGYATHFSFILPALFFSTNSETRLTRGMRNRKLLPRPNAKKFLARGSALQTRLLEFNKTGRLT